MQDPEADTDAAGAAGGELFEQGVLETIAICCVRRAASAGSAEAHGEWAARRQASGAAAAAAGADGNGADHGGRGRAGSRAGAASGRSSRRAPPASDVASGTGDAGSGGAGGGTAGAGRADGGGDELRRVGSRRGAIGLEQHSGGAAVDGGVPPCGGAGRRDCSGADRGAAGACAATEARWCVSPARADGGAGAGGVRAVLVGSGAWRSWDRRTTRRRVCSWMRLRRSAGSGASLG